MSNTTTENKKTGHIVLCGWTLSYPHLKEAHLPPGGTAKRFGVELRLPKDHPNVKAELAKVQGEIDRIKKEKEKPGDKNGKGEVKIFSSDICLKDGDTWEKAKADQRGHWILSVNRGESQGRPTLITRNKQPVGEDSITSVFYPGAQVNAKIGVFHTTKGGGHKIPASLEVLQFWADGTRLGGGGDTSTDDMPEAEDDGDLEDDLPDLV